MYEERELMEWWREGRALKPSLRGETTMSAMSEDLLSLNEKLNRVSSAEDFSVECFLDFSEDLLGHDDDDGRESGYPCSLHEEQQAEADHNSSSASEPFLLDQVQLPLPADDVAELEWVSRVVDDDDSSSLVLSETKGQPSVISHGWLPPPNRRPCAFSFRVPVKPRTKRTRTAKTHHPVWPFQQTQQRSRQKPEVAMFVRRCSHCGATSTPQWRTGPLGPKTLCNACGVRYKSGRLCPEYRPAGSPTFSSQIHSNVHRKVLELRKSKDSNGGDQTESNSAG